MKSEFVIGAVVALALTVPQVIHAAEVPTPESIPMGTKDATKAIAGNYVLDTNHVGLIARVSHLDFSMSVFRFGSVTAKLAWHPKDVGTSTLSATVKTASIESNVPGFAEQLAGPEYLNAAKYPDATFVSTAFHQTDGQHGTVDGTFTLKGKSKPVTFAVTLVGAGPGFAGSTEMGHVLGIHAETSINPQDYDMGPFFTTPIELVIDTEFDRRKAENP